MSSKLALVFSGGGAKGAFSVGAIAELKERFPDLRWHVVSGTSTGSLITPLAALALEEPAAFEQLKELYRRIRKKNIVGSNLVKLINPFNWPEGLHHYKPLKKLLGAVMPPARLQRLAASDTVAVVSSVDLQTGELVLCAQNRHQPGMKEWFQEHGGGGSGVAFVDFAYFVAAMVASSAVPAAAEPETGPPGKNHQVVDGGVLDVAPLRAAIAAGATHLLVFLNNPRRSEPHPKRFDNFFSIGMRAVDLLSDEVTRGDIDYALAVNTYARLAKAVLAEPQPSADLKSCVEENRPALESVARRRPLEIELVEPPRHLGETMDFGSKVWEGWPEAPPAPPDRSIMVGRYEAGQRAAARALEQSPGLQAMLEAFSEPMNP